MTISGKEVPAIPDVLIEDPDIRNILLALKTIAEIREGRHVDKKQRFITYYELVDYLRGNDQLVVAASTTGHNHDDLYATLIHDHDSVYSLLTHDHNKLYSLIIHNHNDLYSIIGHNHNDLYSILGHDHNELYAMAIHSHGDIYSLAIHDHDALYAALGHEHDKDYAKVIHGHGDLYSLSIHDHDALYAALGHNHNLADLAEKAYASLTGKPTIPNVHSDLTDDETAKHRIINDAGVLVTELWSASKISTEIALLSLATHNHNLADLAEKAYASLTGKPAIPSVHSDLTDDEAEKHRLINDAGSTTTVLWSASKIIAQLALYALDGHDHDLDYSDLAHNHNLNDLTEKAYSSLTGKPTIPAAHSDLTDDEATKHRLINDSGSLATELWSASKIIAQLALKSATTHNHNLNDLDEKAYASLTGKPTIPSAHSELSDDEAAKHRLIDDAGSTATVLWSASKIIAQLALKAASTHSHNLNDLDEKAYASLTGTPTIPANHSDLSDDEATKHRLINDSGTTTTVLWSASKIIAQLALKSATSHEHDADYAALVHEHDKEYARVIHDHSDLFSLSIHDHDDSYEPLGHDHDKDYAQVIHDHGTHDHQDVTEALQAQGYFLATM